MNRHAILLAAATLLLVGHRATAETFYVATNGSDAWSGRLPAPNAAKSDGPFVTLARAQKAARQAKQASPAAAAAKIVVRGGVYHLPRPLALSSEDSGLSIEAAPGESVALSGGRVVAGWKPWRGRILQADLAGLDLPDLEFGVLTYNGMRQPLARTPNFDPRHPRHGGFLTNARVVEAGSKTKLAYRPGELDPARWTHPERALVMSYSTGNACYENCLSRVVKMDPTERVLTLDHGVYGFESGDRYYVCNLLEELDAPGEWCVDPERKMLYFWPPDGRLKGEVVVPALQSLVTLEGDANAGRYVEKVRIAGFQLRDTRGAAVKIVGARECTVAACDIRNVDIAVHLDDETHACRVVGNDITQTGNEGIRVWGAPTAHERVSHHVIDNNTIHDFGYGDYHNMNAGVVLWSCSYCQVTHNHIHDGPRFAIGQNGGNNNAMAYNHLHHMNLETCDCALIYTVTSVDWGKPDEAERNKTNAGNEIHHNLMHDAGGYGRDPSGNFEYPHYSWGIYLDLHSSDWSVHDNVVYNTTLGGYHVNGGQNNVCVNNILGTAQRTQMRIGPWPKYPIAGNRFERNIVANPAPGASLYDLGAFQPEYCHFERNLVFSGGQPVRINAAQVRGPVREAWGKWQAAGQDQGSVLADPLFVDAGRHDYRLKPGSPAHKLGFREIDLSGVGNYAGPDRRTWPRPEVKVLREPADYTPRAQKVSQPPLRDYEDYAAGEGERGAAVGQEAGLSSVQVTAETAASGKHSLKFTDAAGQKYPWNPYAAYVADMEEGLVRGGFDLRWEQAADFVYEWRDDPAKYHLGPNLRVDPQGWLAANGKRLLQIPSGRWVRFDVVCGLGERATGKYDLTVRLPGAAPQTFQEVACDPAFSYLQQFVFMSITNGPSVFYVDNVAIRPQTGK